MDWQNTVTNLLKKAEDPAATKEERDALTIKAAYLMAKYDITTLLDRPADMPLNVINVEFQLGAPYAKLRATLIQRIAAAFGCKAVRNVRGRKTTVFGLPEDIGSFSKMFVSLWIQALLALAQSEKPAHVHGKTHNHSYLLGFIDEVCVRVASATAKAKNDSHTATVSTALVFANRETAIDATISTIYPRLRAIPGSQVTNATSYRTGTAAGARADINQPRMGGSQPTSIKALS